jgi:hypothetical protein
VALNATAISDGRRAGLAFSHCDGPLPDAYRLAQRGSLESALVRCRSRPPHRKLARYQDRQIDAASAGRLLLNKKGRPKKTSTIDVTPHVLRHSFASLAGDLGYSELTIAMLIGHKKGSTTSKYVHAADKVWLETADAVASRTAQLVGIGKTAELRNPCKQLAERHDAIPPSRGKHQGVIFHASERAQQIASRE